MDSLLSIVQMPGGVPVGTLAIGNAGAINAGLLAASIVATSGKFPEISKALEKYREKQTDSVAEVPVDSTETVSHAATSVVSHIVKAVTCKSCPWALLIIKAKPKFAEKLIPPGSTIGIVGKHKNE
jgi:hypothetical protein